MNRRKFIITSSTAGTGILLSPPFILTSCTENELANEILFEVVIEVGLALIEGCTYAVCMAGVKNHAVCNVVSKVMGIAAELSIDSMSRKKKGREKVGNGRNVDWKVETKKRGRSRVAKIYYGLSLLADTIDILKTIGCPNGNCNGQAIDWDYVGLFGVGRFPQTAKLYVDKNYIENLSEFDRCIMRNEMYARHGYRFLQTSSVMNYFDNQEWYQSFPNNLRRHDNDWGDFVYRNYFNHYEKSNLKQIQQFKNKCG